MTPSEFKAWFEGFREGIDGAPSIPQWEKIVAKVAEIGTPLIPLHVPQYPPGVRSVGGVGGTSQ